MLRGPWTVLRAQDVPKDAPQQEPPLSPRLRPPRSFPGFAAALAPLHCELWLPAPFVYQTPGCAGWSDTPAHHRFPHRPTARPTQRKFRTTVAGSVAGRATQRPTAPSCEPGTELDHRLRLALPAVEVPPNSMAKCWFAPQVTSVATSGAKAGLTLEQMGNRTVRAILTGHR